MDIDHHYFSESDIDSDDEYDNIPYRCCTLFTFCT